MEFNPFKWFGEKQASNDKTSVEEIFSSQTPFLDEDNNKKISLANAEKFEKESRERKRRNIQLPPGVDVELIDNLADSLGKSYRALRKEPKSIALQTEVVNKQDEIRKAFGNSAEAEVLLANIDIDVETSIKRGRIDNIIYTTYQKLGDLNAYEKILKGRTPEWIDKHLPTLSKMAARSVSVRMALSSTLVAAAAGGVAGGVIALPWLSVAVAAGIGGTAGFYAVRTLYKSRKEKEYNTFIGTIAKEITEKKGIDNLTPNEIKKAAEGLVHGAHHLGKAIGLKEDGSVDTESIAAQVLTRYDKLLKEAGLTGTNAFEDNRDAAFIRAMDVVSKLYSKYDKQQPIETLNNSKDLKRLGAFAQEDFITSDMFLIAYRQELERIDNAGLKYNAECVQRTSLYIAKYVSEQLRNEYVKKNPEEAASVPEIADAEFLKYKVDKRIEDGIMSVRRQGLKDLLEYVRDERTNEKLCGVMGFVGGAAASTLIRAAIYFGTHEETIQDWWAKHFSGIGKVAPGGAPPLSGSIGGGEATASITLPATPSATPSPEATPSFTSVSPAEEQGKITPGFPGETSIEPKTPFVPMQSETHIGTEGTEPSVSGAESAKGARPPSLDNTTLADQYNFLYGEEGSEPESVERLAGLFNKQGIDFVQGIDGKTYDTLTAKVGEGLSDKDTAEDHILMQFLGKVMKGTVHDTFDKTDISGFPAEEKGALLNFMYNLRNDGLLSFDKHTGIATLKYNPEELAREYNEWSRGHDWDIAKADDYAKKISSERWNRWFGFENEGANGVDGTQKSPSVQGVGKHVAVPVQENDAPELDNKKRLATEKGPDTDKNIDNAERRLKDFGARQAPATTSIHVRAVPAAAAEGGVPPSGVATESTGAKIVSAGASGSIAAEAVSAQGAGTSSAKVEQPVAGKMPATAQAVTGHATPSGKVETSAAAPKVGPQAIEELTPEKRFEDVSNFIRKEYGIPKKFIKEISGSFSVKHFMASISTMLEHAKHTVPGELSHFQETGNVSEVLKNKFAEALMEKDFSLGRKLTGVDYHNLAQLQTFLESKQPTAAQKEFVLKDFISIIQNKK